VVRLTPMGDGDSYEQAGADEAGGAAVPSKWVKRIFLLVNGFWRGAGVMLTLVGEQVESLWDDVLPAEIRKLPEDLVLLDRVLSDSPLLSPIAHAWEQDAQQRGRPSIAMATFVRMMVIKQRTGWGYETLVREVSDAHCDGLC
jgi:hypothetical protein